MVPRSWSPSRRQSKKKHKQSEDSIDSLVNDEMSRNRLDGFHAADFAYFGRFNQS